MKELPIELKKQLLNNLNKVCISYFSAFKTNFFQFFAYYLE